MYGRTNIFWLTACITMLFSVSLPGSPAKAQNGLQISYGSKGIQTLSYGGVVLEDQTAYGADTFHIWHMKATDLSGATLSSGQYGWGENNCGEAWDSTTHTETYTFSWGRISTQFVQNGNNLDMVVTETNNPGSGILFDGAEIYPLSLHFPKDPAGFSGYTQYAITTTGPGVSVADYGVGTVTSVIPDESIAIYGGWKTNGQNTYSPLMTTTAPDGLATFLPKNDAPVQPGSSLTYTVSLRFTPAGMAANAKDAYASFAAKYPSQMTWADKRIIGTAYLASSPSGADNTQPGGFPTNPRRYFNDPSVDVTTGDGLQAFQTRVLAQAQSNASNARALNAQGVITWDIEGEQYPQSTSYVCSPDLLPSVAPEMESIIANKNSAYYGRKLDDAYFKTMSDAGLKIGLCLRPQVFTFGANNSASQVYLSADSAIVMNLETKAKYANGRWGATIFYVDSTVDSNGGTLNPAIFQQLITDMPGMLFIPEESTPRYYAYSAPFYTFLFHSDLGTPTSAYSVYPNAFGVNLINDVASSTLSANLVPLTQSVTRGDILMGHADYWQANDPVLISIYAAAGSGTQSPTRLTPIITWVPSPTTYGVPLSAAQLNATANVPGSFVYNPALGGLPAAGSASLQATFTPADTSSYETTKAVAMLNVAKAKPVVSWATPASIPLGTALSAIQLNASANVAGSFTYSPAAGSKLAVGNNTLQVVFTPSDSTDYTTVSASTTLVVTALQKKTPTINWPSPAPIVYGTPLSGTQLNAVADAAGTFAYSPASGAILSAGTNTLKLTFTPSDSTQYVSATATTTLSVAKAMPSISWATPNHISYGTALSAVQLNASANVAGNFVYSPAAGAVLNAGTNGLQAVFTPSDVKNYSTQTAGVNLVVDAPVTANVKLAILSPTAGATVSGVIRVAGDVRLALDSAGSYLMLDGVEVVGTRLTSGPYVYQLNTTTIANGTHTLQLWAHDIGNITTISQAIRIVVVN